MTASEQAALIGTEGLLEIVRGSGVLQVRVRILDTKEAYGTVRVQVTPVAGFSAAWVQLGQLIVSPTED